MYVNYNARCISSQKVFSMKTDASRSLVNQKMKIRDYFGHNEQKRKIISLQIS